MPVIAAAVWAGTWTATGEQWGPVLGLIAVAAGVAVVSVWRQWTLAVVAAALAVAAVTTGGVRTAALVHHPVRASAVQEMRGTAEFTLRTDPRRFSGSATRPTMAVAGASLHRLETRNGAWEDLRGRVKVRVTGEDADALVVTPVGSRIRASVSLRAPERGDPELAVMTLRNVEVIDPPSVAGRGVERVRQGLRDAVADLPPEQRALVPSLVVGDVREMSEELREDFVVTGLTHLTAVSGANLSILAAFCMVGARWIGVRGRWLLVVGAGAVVLFIALCRTEPSVLRAAAMGVVALLAIGAHTTTERGLRHLAVAMTGLLVLDPWLARSLGFALSVLASAGIIGFARRWTEAMCWMPRWLAELWSVPLAAQLATQPVVTLISDRVSVVGLVTNAVTGPVVGPATVLGFATAGLSVIAPPVAGFTGWLAGWCAQWILWSAHVGASLPGAELQWPATPFALTVVAAASAAALILGREVVRRRLLTLGLMTALVVMALHAPPSPHWPPRRWQMVSCDVGQGDATVLYTGSGSAVVVDTGPDVALLRRCLDQLGIRHVPLLVLTHYHADHIDGRAAVWPRMDASSQVWVSPVASPRGAAHAVAAEARERGAAVMTPAVGASSTIGDTTVRVLGPVRVPRGLAVSGEGESAAENDTSLVLHTETEGLRALLPGDLEPPGQGAVQREWGALPVDVLKIPHHGSGNQDPDFLTVHHAPLALVSCGLDNDHGHPADKTVDLVQSHHMRLHRTDLEGSIAFTRNAERIEVISQSSTTRRNK